MNGLDGYKMKLRTLTIYTIYAGAGTLLGCGLTMLACGGVNRHTCHPRGTTPEAQLGACLDNAALLAAPQMGYAGVDPARTQSIYTADVSAYCPCSLCCGIYADGITASGHAIQPGDRFVAAPPELPFGTMLDIPGYGLVPVLDRGGAIKGNKLDVYHDSHEAALRWGRQNLLVTIEGAE